MVLKMAALLIKCESRYIDSLVANVSYTHARRHIIPSRSMKARVDITAKMVTSLDKEVGLERFVPVHILQQLSLVGSLLSMLLLMIHSYRRKTRFVLIWQY